MTETKDKSATAVDVQEAVPAIQQLFERPILLLVAGTAVILVTYTIWGLVEIMTLPTAPLP